MKFLLAIFTDILQYFFMITAAGDRIHVVIYSESDLFSVCFPALKNPMQSTSTRPFSEYGGIQKAAEISRN